MHPFSLRIDKGAQLGKMYPKAGNNLSQRQPLLYLLGIYMETKLHNYYICVGTTLTYIIKSRKKGGGAQPQLEISLLLACVLTVERTLHIIVKKRNHKYHPTTNSVTYNSNLSTSYISATGAFLIGTYTRHW